MTNQKAIIFRVIRLVLFWGVMGLFSCGALAQTTNSTIFQKAYDQLYTTFTEARLVVYITAGFGLCGFATAAIFGKLSWRWLSTIAIALFTLAAAEKVVSYVITDGTSITSAESFLPRDKDFDLSGVRSRGGELDTMYTTLKATNDNRSELPKPITK